MTARSYLLMTALILLSAFAAYPQSQACGCADKKDLLTLLNMSQIAIQEYKLELELIRAKEVADQRPVMFSRPGYVELLEKVGSALNAITGNEPSNLYSAFTMNVSNCSVTERSGHSPCLLQVYRVLKDVWKRACDQTKDLPVNESPYREMKQVVQLDISAYQEMQNFIIRTMRSLPKECRPNNWFGYVVYQRLISRVSNKTIPPNSPISRPTAGISITTGGNETTGSKSTYVGTVIVENGNAVSTVGYASNSFDQSKMITGRIYCSPKIPDTSIIQTNGMKAFIEGTLAGNGTFRLDVYPKRYHIYLGFFAVPVTGQQSTFGNTTGGCAGKPFNYSNSISNRIDAPDFFAVDEAIDPGSPDLLEGIKIEQRPGGNSTVTSGNISTTTTEEIRVKWMLRRFPSK